MPGDRVGLADGEMDQPHRHLVTEGPALILAPGAHRHHDPELHALHLVLAMGEEEVAHRPGDDGEDGVVDGAAEGVLDRLDVVEGGLGPVETPVGADLGIEGGGVGHGQPTRTE